ncbi:DUF819 family protein [Virgibacillus sp. AGTR]|uniref:DUF819 family protein n=1 Tax=unclassified Virgibacillus TaxID=2620237 RepID=UPI000EF4573C|nr:MULTISPECIES: DUF819 family protein [unclassified Virgibacillus]MCC2248472.1 DUF819 family protein [Virgibacillus sp. AGTR]MDY7043093.1 DUF819 family protein [Virgibacillus sp. M23]QRZ16663.1 DUF819 domain-containing protein [Virgibacillus sp. AGTR]
MITSIISSEDTWLLWAFMAGWAAVSICLEQKYKWASKVTGAIIALVGAMVLVNINVIPSQAPAYDAVWSYVVPLAIPLLLFQANLKKIWNESGRMLLLFLISSIGTVIGGFVAYMSMHQWIPNATKITGLETGSYTGGGVNFAALSAKLEVPGELASSAIVADNILMALYFFTLIMLPAITFIRNRFHTPYLDELEQNNNDSQENGVRTYWKRKEVSLKDIAFAIGIAFALVAISFKLAEVIDQWIPSGEGVGFFYNVLNGLFGDGYLMLTSITVFVVTVFHRFFENIHGAQEIGTYLIYIFFVVIGVPASLPLLISNAPLLLLFLAIMVLFNMLVTFTVGKLFKFSLEEMIVASNANIGGPTTAAAFAIAKGWTKLIVPIMLVGTLGYVIGNYLGSMVYYLLP